MKHAKTVRLLVTSLVLGIAAFAVAQDQPVEVTEILLGTSTESGVVTSPTTTFSRTDPGLYCMVRIQNRTGAEGHIRIAFESAGAAAPEAGERGRRFAFPARSRYRTVSRGTPNRPPGTYRCVVRTDAGAVLSHQDFTITE